MGLLMEAEIGNVLFVISEIHQKYYIQNNHHHSQDFLFYQPSQKCIKYFIICYEKIVTYKK